MEELLGQEGTKDVWYYVGALWSSLAVGVIVYLGGVTAKKVARLLVRGIPEATLPLSYRLWYATIDWHPVAVGALLGLVPWPVPDFAGRYWFFRVLWFAGVGAISGQVYKAIKSTIEVLPEFARKKAGLAPKPTSDPPESPAPAADAKDDPGAIPKE